MKIPACKSGGKHSWRFVRNLTIKREHINSASLTMRGMYTCAHCGVRKYGSPCRDNPAVQTELPLK